MIISGDGNETVKPRVRINTLYGESDGYQQKRIKQTLTKALNAHPRTALIRFDLRFPQGNVVYRDDAEVITRFFKSLNEKFPVYLKKRAERGVRVHNSELRYLWVREFSKVGESIITFVFSLTWIQSAM